MNKTLICIALVTGTLCGLWAGGASFLHFSVWAGFAGCTTYFACGQTGFKGLRMAILTNVLGVLGGYVMAKGGDVMAQMMPSPWAVGLAVGVIVVGMVLCASVSWIAFVPGIFVGCFSFFAGNGDWQLLVPSLIAGAFLGAACERGGTLLAQKI